MKVVRIGALPIACEPTPGTCMQSRNLAAVALVLISIGAGCRTSQPEQALVLTRPPAGAYRDPDPTYGVPLPLKIILASDYSSGGRNGDPGQKTPRWLKKQVTV